MLIKSLGFSCSLIRLMTMDPGGLVPDIGHLEKILVQTGLADEFLEFALMGS